MSTAGMLLMLAVVCAAVASVAAVLITAWLDRRGVQTPFLWMRLFFFRNMGRYKTISQRETGQVGGLFWLFVVPINAALVFALAAVVLQFLR